MKHLTPRPPQFHIQTRRSASGLGLFAREPIPAGRFVVEYWGKLMTDDEAQEIGGRYLFEIGNGKTIEGSTRENIARYANHSCDPNAEVRIRGNHVEIWSLRPMAVGEEITYDYGKEYWEYYIKPHGCRCRKCTKQ